MNINFANGATLAPVSAYGAKRFCQGANRDTLSFIFPASAGLDALDAAFTAESCETITIIEDSGVEHIHNGYTIRAELKKEMVEVTPATVDTEAVTEERITVSMAQRTYMETQLSALTTTYPDTLSGWKTRKIAESKNLLAEYLEEHPLTWSDGKQYSVTAEKQSLLTGNLSAYSIAVQLGVTPNPLTWNTTGSECTEWTFVDLGALALAIQAYVKPFVSYQQSKELEIKACTTVNAVKAVVIDYESAGA